MPSESIPEDERLALARALRHVGEEDAPNRTPENREEIARLFGEESAEPPAAEASEEERSGPRFRLLHLLIGLLVLACLALIVPLGLDFFGSEESGEIPVIQAQQQPDKVRPEEPGGLQVPHQDVQVLNPPSGDSADPQVERLLPPPETPEPLPIPNEGVAALETPAAPELTLPPAAEIAPEVPASPSEAASESSAAAEAVSTPEPATTESAAAPAASEPEPSSAQQAAEAMASEGTGSTEAAPAASEAPAEAATTQEAALPPATAPAGEGIYIQLGSLGKRDGVSAEWARLQKAFPDFLGDMELAVQTVTLEGRGTFHRIQTGPFPNRGTAEEMCAFLKSSDQACIVIKR